MKKKVVTMRTNVTKEYSTSQKGVRRNKETKGILKSYIDKD